MSLITLEPLVPAQRKYLSIVDSYDPDLDYQKWRAAFRVPATFAPVDLTAKPVVFVVLNQKGGAGKTTTSLELAAAFAAMGLRVRLIDADPQDASLSIWLLPVVPEGRDPEKIHTLYDVFTEKATLDDATYPTEFENLFIVPSKPSLMMVELDSTIAGAESALKWAITDSEMDIDVTIIDGPPSLGRLSTAALVAAQNAVIPVAVGGLDVKGMKSLSDTVNKIQRRMNPDLRVVGSILTRWQRSTLARQMEQSIAAGYPEAVIGAARYSIRLAEAPLSGKPLLDYDRTSPTASDYQQFAGLLVGNKE